MSLRPNNLLLLTAIVTLLCALGCGGGAQAIQNLPPPPPVLPQVDGTYTFTLAGFNSTPDPTIHATLKQGPWNGDSAALDVSGNASTAFCAPDGQQWAVAATITKADALSMKFTLPSDITNPNGNTILTITADDFSKLSGTWKPGPDISSCNGFTTTGPGFTWKAVKQ